MFPESILGHKSKTEEDIFLEKLWPKLSGDERLQTFSLVVTVLPFNRDVLTNEEKVFSTADFPNVAEIVSAEGHSWTEIREDLQKRGTDM